MFITSQDPWHAVQGRSGSVKLYTDVFSVVAGDDLVLLDGLDMAQVAVVVNTNGPVQSIYNKNITFSRKNI